jgi:hypothetical protein
MRTMISVFVVSVSTHGDNPAPWNASITCCRPVEPRSKKISGKCVKSRNSSVFQPLFQRDQAISRRS